MIEVAMNITGLKINKSTWNKVRFGDVVSEPRESCKEIVGEGIQHVVGLEHIDSEDIHLRRSASADEPTTFTKKFKKGDVLFGRRRAYLKKAAQAEFEGICSGDINVLRAKKELIPELLPFLVNNDKFFDHAIKHSAGGLSPRVKFKDLANYEFLLPTKDEQARLAELLWAMDDVIEKERKVLEKIESSYNAMIDNLFSTLQADWYSAPVSKIAEVNVRSLKGNHNPEYVFRYLDIASILGPKTLGELTEFNLRDAPSRARRITSQNSIVMSLVRPYFKAFVHLDDSKNIIASTGTAVLDTKKGHHSKFIFYQFFSKRFMKFCENRMIGTNYPAISPAELKQYNLFLPRNLKSEIIISNKLENFDSSIVSMRSKIAASQSLLKSLMNQIF